MKRSAINENKEQSLKKITERRKKVEHLNPNPAFRLEKLENYVRRLEISNMELTHFAHMASHDLREPLRMVGAFMGLLQKSLSDQLTEQQKQFFEFALDGTKRMDYLIKDLLQVARMDAAASLELVSLNDVVDEVKLNLDFLLKEKGAIITCNNLPQIISDHSRMVQLFQNIINNGIKYNESVTPHIHVRCTEGETEYHFSISDNGIGIPKMYREKVFEMYERLPTRRTYSGTGLGLAICKKIVDTMNGKISIEEGHDGGSVFIILLPRNAALENDNINNKLQVA